jgi:hypothetical protein
MDSACLQAAAVSNGTTPGHHRRVEWYLQFLLALRRFAKPICPSSLTKTSCNEGYALNLALENVSRVNGGLLLPKPYPRRERLRYIRS